ncbi:hypothetical protein [Dyadobacter sp. 676]|uniref:SDR family NAD(P)-dependent oxidoreductase n=1 Tax=Dyadobacter sp. 676 TaxID=3088362 RepID=A0AAU8FW60_9BACT
METWLINKSIVIIGGTTGVGLSAAQAFVRNGANVVVVGSNPESCLLAELNLGGQCKSETGRCQAAASSIGRDSALHSRIRELRRVVSRAGRNGRAPARRSIA